MANEYFGQSTDRIRDFRYQVLYTDSTICTERARLTTESYKKHADKPVVLKRAYCVDNVLRNMSIFIEDKTLIVGNQASANRAAPIFPEYAMDWVVKELDEYEKRDGDRFTITEENKQILRDIYPYWEGHTLKDKGLALFPEDSRLLYDLGFIKAEGNITSGDAHIAVNYGRVLELGLEGFREYTLKMKNKLDLADVNDLKKLYFYDAVLIVLDAVEAFAERFSKLAAELAAKETDPKRKAELEEISAICARVPKYPAQNFHEAVQSTWFIHLILQIESNGHSLSYGRMDQFLIPYYKKDLEAGKITRESASELLENLWLKTFTINKIRSYSHTKFSAGSPLYQNVTVGGQTRDGKDAVNDLSYLILQSVARIRLPQPNLTVRYHRGLDDRFMKECVEVIKLGFGMPAFNSDEIIIPSFIDRGVAKEDAYDYSAIGCVEVAVPGKWGYRCTGMSFINFPRTLLAALNDGVDTVSGKRIYEPTGLHFKDMTSFDQVMKAWERLIRAMMRQTVIIDSCADLALEQEVPDILCSALTDDCIGRGKHIKEGGAVYDFISGLQVGIANLADSLAVIKKLVFEEKKLTASALWEACLNDYAGEEGARILKLVEEDVPKYGNNDDYVDSLIVEAYGYAIDELGKYHNTRYGRGPIGGGYYAGTSSISANVPQGMGIGATPDGRRAHTPLAEGCSPSHGADKNGPTAVFQSVAKLPTHEITGGVLLNQKMTPQVLAKEKDCEKLIAIIRTFFNTLKGFHVQYNVVARETLMDAQKHPENYRDLVVRVAGYSAFFNVLSTETQNDIIARTEQTL